MNKLSLKLDDLRIESFETAGESASRGTVLGHGPTVNGKTCGYSCPNTCGIVPDTYNCRDGRNSHDCPNCV